MHLPFGGTKATGNGHREAGTAALDVFSEWKSIYVDFSGRLQRAQIDTGSETMRIRSLMILSDPSMRIAVIPGDGIGPEVTTEA